MIGVSNHLLSIVFRFHYHSQKVIGSLELVKTTKWWIFHGYVSLPDCKFNGWTRFLTWRDQSSNLGLFLEASAFLAKLLQFLCFVGVERRLNLGSSPKKQHVYHSNINLSLSLYIYLPGPSKGVKFQPPGLCLVVKGPKFQTLGGFRYIDIDHINILDIIWKAYMVQPRDVKVREPSKLDRKTKTNKTC